MGRLCGASNGVRERVYWKYWAMGFRDYRGWIRVYVIRGVPVTRYLFQTEISIIDGPELRRARYATCAIH